ncbi:MAG TPA: hypothetical protein DCW68_01295 [Rhodospirillaceae bacterium]|nr:MAG: hypothetical protein A2018_04260 [Alphaproteobacteria bacterium GWF2_58_20]HAU28734.1 hypothetical protein [Rhodospirillaceae bacterium]
MSTSCRNAFVFVIIFTVARLAMLAASGLYLLPDEAQYWVWSRHLDLGYFSKPPMIAWLIHLTTAVGGNAPFWVRLASPLLHGATALLIVPLVKELGWGEKRAFWAAMLYMLLPMVTFSSMFMTTDVPLLFFWTFSLLAFHRACRTGQGRWAFVTGLLVALGLLAKYAMAYFAVGAALYLWFDKDARKRLGTKGGTAIVGTAFLGIVPNLLWNVKHDWITFAHTASNANMSGSLFSFREGLVFMLSQFAVFGPFLMIALLFSVSFLLSSRKTAGAGEGADSFKTRVYLHAFTWPPLLLMIGLSFLTRANANWAALAYVGGLLLAVEWMLAGGRKGWITASVFLHGTLVLVLFFLSLPAMQRVLLPPVNVFAAQQRFGATAEVVANRVGHFYPDTTVMADERKIMASLVYALRNLPVRVRMWPYDRTPANHFELTQTMTRDEGAKVLWVTNIRANPVVVGKFETSRLIESLSAQSLAGGKGQYYIMELTGYKP